MFENAGWLWFVLQINMTVHSRIVKIDIDRFQVDLTTKSSDLLDKDGQWKWVDFVYRNFPKFSDRQVWANIADPDQTAPRGAVWSGSTLFAVPSASFGLITLW